MSQLRMRELAKGIVTHVPVVGAYACRSSGGTVSARYCYGVWMRHLVRAAEAGLDTSPRAVAELGPGDSFGIGLAAVLSGADRYSAFDAKPHAHPEQNLQVFEELVGLFQRRERIPDQSEFPNTFPVLASYDFPSGLLRDARLTRSLDAARLDLIRAALRGTAPADAAIRISYAAPWDATTRIEPGTIDMALSQAVLEHVEDVPNTYKALHRWIRPGGFMSHSIDFKSHGLTTDWNGHWTVGDGLWRIARGNRPYLINRLPYSVHLAAMKDAGFTVVAETPRYLSALPRAALAERFRGLTDDDLRISGVFVQAQSSR